MPLTSRVAWCESTRHCLPQAALVLQWGEQESQFIRYPRIKGAKDSSDQILLEGDSNVRIAVQVIYEGSTPRGDHWGVEEVGRKWGRKRAARVGRGLSLWTAVSSGV